MHTHAEQPPPPPPPPKRWYVPPPTTTKHRSHGYNVGLVSRYGVWSNTYGEECVSSQSRWRPLPLHDTAYITLRLNNVSAATAGGQIHTVGLLAHSANIQAPVPGACASTGVLEYNSMVESSVEDEVVALAFQQSDMGITREKCDFDECGEHTCNCDFVVDSDKKEGGTLKYELYSAAATSCGSDFHHDIGVAEVMVTLGKMSTLAGAKKFGTLYNGALLPEQVKAFEVDEATGQGIVYTIVVTDEFQAKQNPQLPQEIFQSIYTPVHSFGCIPEGMASPPGSESLPACAGLTSYSLLIVRVLTGLLGIYMGLYGHRHYYGMAFISFTLVGTGAAYATLGWASGTSILGLNLSYAALMPLSLLAGLLLAALLYAAWIQFDLMGVYAVFQGAVMGFVLAAFLMATPLGEVDIFATPFNYAMVYSCVVLFTPLLFLIRSRPISLASTSFVGAYCTLLPFDFFLGSDFDAIVGNVFRRATDPTFAKAYSGHYFADDFNGCTNVAENAGFFAAWCALTLLYLALQLMCTARGVRVPTSALGAPTPRSLWRSLWLQRAIVRSKSPEELRSLLSPPPPSARHGSIQDYPRAWEDGSSGSQSE